MKKILFTIIVFLTIPSAIAQVSGKQPNVVIIFVDDMGYADIGPYGATKHRTPNLDRLAGDGILFRQAFCAAPQCSPSRASLFTGRYPHSHGVMGLTHDPFGWDLPDSEHHLASILKSAGYATSVFGVSHEARRNLAPR